jgi:hypothetical protein
MGFIKWIKTGSRWKKIGYLVIKPTSFRAELLIDIFYVIHNHEYEAEASIYVNSLHNPQIGYMSEEEREKMILKSKILEKNILIPK